MRGRAKFSIESLSLSAFFFALILASGCGGPSTSPSLIPVAPTTANGHFRLLKSVTPMKSVSAAALHNTSGPTAGMTYARSQATATLLIDGRVLLAGGSSDPVGTYTAELFDPATETFSLLDSTMSWGRMNHCAVTLLDGKVLLIGGVPMIWMTPVNWVSSTVDVFDPTTNSFSAHELTGALPDNSDGGRMQCILLPSARVLILTAQSGPMVLDTKTWQTRALEWNAGSMPMNSSVAQTSDGKVWFVGGVPGEHPGADWSSTANICWFRPETESLSIVGQLIQPRDGAGILPFPDNSVEVYGGAYSEAFEGGGRSQPIASIEHIDSQGVASEIGDLPMPKYLFTSVMLQNGKSLHVGGSDINGSTSDTQYVFDETTRLAGATGNMIEQRSGYAITPLATGRVLILGGSNGQVPSKTAEIFEPDANIYVLIPKTTVAPGEFIQLSAESSTSGLVTWIAKYGTVTTTGGYTAPSANPNGPSDSAATLQDEVTAALSTGAKAQAPIIVQFPATTNP